jgi:hypothetical protein
MATATLLSLLMLVSPSAARHARGPGLAEVVQSPEDYSGKSLTFDGLTLSGTVTKYDVSGVRKYYLTVETRHGVYEAGFFLAPPGLADKLTDKMNPKKNYRVNVTCTVKKLTINGVAQWHGVVSAVAFVDGDGKVTATLKADKK